jgi:type VI secretion system protein ImpF
MPPSDVRAQASVLDRLIDLEPKNSQEVPVGNAQAMRNYKAAVRRDLEWLLNSRCAILDLGEEYEALEQSVYTYGLPDFSAYGSMQAKTRLLRAVRRAIEVFEPRLMNIEVSIIDDPVSKQERIMRFLITGLLRMDPAPEQVAFDTRLEMINSEYSVQEG